MLQGERMDRMIADVDVQAKEQDADGIYTLLAQIWLNNVISEMKEENL